MSEVLNFVWFLIKTVLIILGCIFLYIIWALNNLFGSNYVNKNADDMIESEYKKSLNRFNLLLYRNLPSNMKKNRLDNFISKNPKLVDKIKKESLQNSVNAVIAKYNNEKIEKYNLSESDNATRYNFVDKELQAIIDIASESFNITLSNGDVMPIKPKIKHVYLWSPSNDGYVIYDVEATISEFKNKLNKDNDLVEEGIKQINNTLKEYSNSKYKSASITAVATALIRNK
jgi:hypothetical protein